MAMLKNGKNRSGDTVLIPLMNGKLIEATVTDSVFYDKEGLRQND
jgi:sarcosine oxidase subunit alpha